MNAVVKYVVEVDGECFAGYGDSIAAITRALSARLKAKPTDCVSFTVTLHRAGVECDHERKRAEGES